ncbi:MAG TPA: F0F1 ATP synthase subunit delta [Candidatus Acidoferrum sp.]|jgi:F-type H+-transporting ATPase subunit delta|nr:F0F1 ATP synthase subunit delta [Candidatus Acidoferrum sp.]
MARPTSAARRYAEAAFQLAGRDDTFDAWAADLSLAADLIGDERVAHVVNNPSVALSERQAALGRLLGKRVTPLTLNLVRLLDQRGRLRLLPAIAADYTALLDAKRGIVAATVTSATPLGTDETDAVRARVEAITGSTVKLQTAVDPALIGGLTVQIGDRMIDASVRGRLERLRDQLVAGSR